MQKEITQRKDILDADGKVINSGWARDDLFNYERNKIKSGPLRIKEWDFWEVFNADYRVVLNIFDIGLAGLAMFTFTDFQSKESVNASMGRLLSKGKTGHPPSWRYSQPFRFARGKSWMEFSKEGNTIILKCNFPRAAKGKGISGEAKLEVHPNTEGIANLIPFEDPHQFVYAEKLCALPANGSFKIGDRAVEFSAQNNSWGVLDWTRAVFPHKNHWKWCTAAGMVNGKPFGFNLDYGFGTESSKSMLFVAGRGHHLDEISYQHDKKNLDAPLIITSNDNRVNLVLKPKFIEKQGVDIGIIAMKGLSTTGFFTGEVVLDSGEKLQIRESDKVFGWAEEYYQKW